MIYFRRTTAVKRQFLNYTLSIGAILAFPAQHFVCVIPVSGGAPRQVRPDFESAASPIWSPDGKRILFAGARRLGDGQDWWVTSLNGGAVFKTGAVSALAHQGLLTADVIPSVSAWTGAHVYFAGHQGDSTDCWRFRISTTVTWMVRRKGSPTELRRARPWRWPAPLGACAPRVLQSY
jgi:hypothetical protein